MNAAQLVGVWELQEFVLQTAEEESRPFGDRPKGRLHVAENGQLLVAIFSEHRSKVASDDLQAGQPDEASALLRGSLSYFGRWRFEAERAVLCIEAEGALFPNLEGTTQERVVTWRGADTLVLTTAPVAWGGREQRGILSWRRMPTIEAREPAHEQNPKLAVPPRAPTEVPLRP